MGFPSTVSSGCFCLVALHLYACQGPDTDDNIDTDLVTFGEVQHCVDPAPGLDRFTESSAERGLDFVLPNATDTSGVFIEGRGGNVAMHDLDLDGDLDLVFLVWGFGARAYLNDGEANFSEAGPGIELNLNNSSWVALALGVLDITGDRDPEVVLSADGKVFMVSLNEDMSIESAPVIFDEDNGDQPSAILSVSFGDMDGDSDLDLVVPTSGTDGQTMEGGPDYVVMQEDGVFVPRDTLLLADGGSRTMVAMHTDRDGDGDMDLLIPPDLGPALGFWRNDGIDEANGTPIYEDDAEELGMKVVMAAMGIDAADLNEDGTLDYIFSDVGVPRLFMSDGSGRWYDDSIHQGLHEISPHPDAPFPSVGWNVDLADLNNDGWSEVIQASAPDNGAMIQGWSEYPDLVYEGLPGGGFDEVGASIGLNDIAGHVGLVTGDLNGDGWLDLVFSGPGVSPTLHMNRCGASHWLEVDLVGPTGNTEAYGAHVIVEAGGRSFLREMEGIRAQGQGPSVVHVGLGEAEEIDRLTVRFLGGATVEAAGFAASRRVTVRHPAAE